VSRLQALGWIAAAVAAVGAAVYVIVTSDRPQGAGSVVAGLAAASFLATGIVARIRRPANRTGTLMMATGFFWCLGAANESSNGWVYALGSGTNSLVFIPFAHLMLSFPSGELTSRRHRSLVGAVAFFVTVPVIATALVSTRLDPTCGACPDNPLAAFPSQTAADILDALVTTLAVGLILWLLTEIWLRFRAASPPLRRTLMPVLATSGASIAILVVATIVSVADEDAGDAVAHGFVASFALVPIAFLAGVLRSRLAGASVAGLLDAFGRGGRLRDSIAEALGDPTLEIGYWLPRLAGYAAADGTSLRPDAGRSSTAVELDGRPIALLVHDRALDDERELLRAVAAAAGLSLERERLQAELRAQLALQVTIADTAPSLLLSISVDGRIESQNRAAVAAAGLDDEAELHDRFFWDVFIDGWEREAMRGRFFAAAPEFPPAVYENAFTDARGKRRAIIWQSAPLRDESGRVVSIVAGGLDITERKEGERDLQRQRGFASTVFDTIPSYLVVTDAGGVVVANGVNRSFVETFGWAPGTVDGRTFLDVVAEPEREAAAATIALAASGVPQSERETAWLAVGGDTRIVAWTATPVLDPTGADRVLVCGADVTVRHRQEEEIRASRSRIVQAGDEARRKLERNLHDGAQQRLVALSLSLRLVESTLTTDPERATTLFAAAREDLGHALEELRELARGIHPAILTDRGLKEALTAVASRAPLPVALDVTETRLPAAIEAAAYYVVAEGLTNVARYAHARSVDVRVQLEDGSVIVEVRDDGVGGASAEPGTGLRGLRDRVSALDGTLTLDSPQAAGTCLRALIPLRREVNG
jgi:PAS domain S-box-containing protein